MVKFPSMGGKAEGNEIRGMIKHVLSEWGNKLRGNEPWEIRHAWGKELWGKELWGKELDTGPAE